MADISNDYSSVWVNGKIEQGFYMAKQVWSKDYANHLRELGYEVERRVPDPDNYGHYKAVPDTWTGVSK